MYDRLIELIQAGGFVMPPLMVGSAFLWFGLFHRFQVLRRGQRGTVVTILSKERFENNTPFLGYLLKLKENPENKNVSHVILSSAHQEFSSYKTLISTVVMIAPLLGLLGTVSGMIETFDSLGDMSLFTQSGGIAGGISQALVSTQMGLAVAIPGLIIGRILNRKQTSLMVDLEQAGEYLHNKGISHA
jgi:biopolymer transport protein ExbB